MALRKFGFAILLTISMPVAGWAGGERPSRVGDNRTSPAGREQQFATLAVHDANFSAMSRMTARLSCEATQPPEALATPDPLVDAPAPATKITVSFIVGTDGRVHSPLILESLGPS